MNQLEVQVVPGLRGGFAWMVLEDAGKGISKLVASEGGCETHGKAMIAGVSALIKFEEDARSGQRSPNLGATVDQLEVKIAPSLRGGFAWTVLQRSGEGISKPVALGVGWATYGEAMIAGVAALIKFEERALPEQPSPI